jgi:DNA-binding winged helix-turn-helix (wHTH) protein/Tol biopolymer transport system component
MAQEEKGFYDFGRFTLVTSDHVLLAGDKKLSLSPRAFDLLQCFVTNPGALVTREQLKLSVWRTANVSDNSIDQKIAELRKVFGQVDPRVEYIQNKHGQGWRFVVEVEKRTEPGAQALIPGAAPVDEPHWVPRKGRSKIHAAIVAGLAITVGALAVIESTRDSEPRITDYRQLTDDGLPKEGRLLTDGRLIYFTERVSHDAEAHSRLATVAVQGGDVAYLPAPAPPVIALNIDPVVEQQFYTNRTPVGLERLTWRSTKGSPEPTGTDSGLASIAPDGRLLAFGGSHRNLCIRDLEAAQRVREIPLQGYARSPIWSIDGKRIRFRIEEPASLPSTLWEVRRDGSDLHQLPISAGNGQNLSPEGWTADGRYFIFSEFGELDHHAGLWIVPEASLGFKQVKPVRLTSAPMDFRAAVVAPDDSAVFAIGTKFHNELERFDLRANAYVSYWEGFPAIDLAFSNDGAWAAFARYPECTLWVSRADGSDRRQITAPDIEAHQPHWSPDGSRIAFMGRMPGKPSKIYIVNASGGAAREVKPEDPFDQGVPSWSGDGCCLTFGELKDRKPDAEMVIRVLDLRTGTETILPGSNGKWSPRWSPDGRYILAQTTDFKDLELFDCKAQTWKSLARATQMNDASWSLDSKFVHFEARVERGRALLRVRVDDGKVEQLALQPEFEYSWSGVAPDGSPLTLRAVKIEEVYALNLKVP